MMKLPRAWLDRGVPKVAAFANLQLAWASSFSSGPSASHVDMRHAPNDYDASSAVVYGSIISHDEGIALVTDALARMKRRRYERGHWDAVILNYKEVELLDEEALSEVSRQVMNRIRVHLEARHLNHLVDGVSWLPCHAIDLQKDNGELKAHVDSVKFSGGLVAGLSLLSPSIMRLKPESDTPAKEQWVDLYLPPLSLYVLTGMSRYQYTHELLPSGSMFETPEGSISVERDQRLSIIFRDAKQDL